MKNNTQIKDDARKQIAQITFLLEKDFPNTKESWIELGDGVAGQVLSISGETDEVCQNCDGLGEIDLRDSSPYTVDFMVCQKCKGTGHKLWELKLVVDGRVIE